MSYMCCIVVVCMCDMCAHGCIHIYICDCVSARVCVCVLYAFMELFSEHFEIIESIKLLRRNAEQLATERSTSSLNSRFLACVTNRTLQIIKKSIHRNIDLY